jgi:hypothetical protein
MAIVEAWDATLPPGTENPALGDDRIRELKRSIAERMVNAGLGCPNGVVATAGRLACGVQGAVGKLDALYESDGTTVLLDVRDSTASTFPQGITWGSGIGGVRPYKERINEILCAKITVGVAGGAGLELRNEGAAVINLTRFVTPAMSPYTVLAIDHILLFNATGGVASPADAITVNLPAVFGTFRRLELKLYETDGIAHVARLVCAGADTLDGAPTPILTTAVGSTRTGIIIQNDGLSRWHTIASVP